MVQPILLLTRLLLFVTLLLLGLVVVYVGKAKVWWPKSGRPEIEINWEKEEACSQFPEQIEIELLQKYAPDDPEIINYIRCHHLYPPSKEPYPSSIKFTKPSEFARDLERIFKYKNGGFFIECGANDGYYLSNTFALEHDKKWTGLLVEANPKLKHRLLHKHRKAWFADVCLSPNNAVSEMKFLVSDGIRYQWETGIGKIDMPDDVDTVLKANTDKYNFKSHGTVRCFPLLSLLQAIGVSHVDYFSLDVQGVELKILKTLPFDDRLRVDVIDAEYLLVPENKTAMRNFMESKGYTTLHEREETFTFMRKAIEQ